MLLVARGSLFGQTFVRVDLKMVTVIKAIASLSLTMSVSKTEILLNIIKYKTEIYNCFHERGFSEHFPSDGGGGGAISVRSWNLVLDSRWTFQNHFCLFLPRIWRIVAALRRLMVNIDRSGENRHRVYAFAFISFVLYGPIWAQTIAETDIHVVRWSSSNGNFYLKWLVCTALFSHGSHPGEISAF